jgi:hypothetical protein
VNQVFSAMTLGNFRLKSSAESLSLACA